MKNSTIKNTLIFSLLFVLSLSFIACSGDEAAYKKEIETADTLFQQQQYNEAKTIYLKASELNKEDTYAKNQIEKINGLLADIKAKELEQEAANKKPEIEATPIKVKVANSYLVVIASYAIASNANIHQEKLNNKGYKATIIESDKGNFLISLQDFDTETKAYNYLESLSNSEDYDLNKAWVYQIK